MSEPSPIQIDLVKLTGGERMLRLTDSVSGMSLEKKLNPTQPVFRQKERFVSVFEAALARAALSSV